MINPSFNKGRFGLQRTQSRQDRAFTKQLRALDPELELVWNFARSVWEIWRKPSEDSDRLPAHVMTIQTQGRTYRELGADILVTLQKLDPARYTVNQIISYLEAQDDRVRDEKERTLRNNIRALAQDCESYIRGVLKVQVPRSLRFGQSLREEA